MEKVKYNRREYREEYLKSDEWKNLRSAIIGSGCDCQCCVKVKATDVHHMVYRNIVDITVNDLIPVCRPCHELIHQAIDDNYISQDPKDFATIKTRTFGILIDDNYTRFRDWLTSKHHLRNDEVMKIRTMQPFVIKKISALVRKNIWYDDLIERKFTGRQIVKIRKILEVARYRKDANLDRPTKRKSGRPPDQYSKYDSITSLTKMPGFKSRKSIKKI